MQPQQCLVHHLGLIPYEEAWHLQEIYAAQIARGERPPTLLLLEHPHIFTFGRRGRAENLLWNANQLEQAGARVVWVDRGGDVTYHGPGQLVGYPLFPLAPVGIEAAGSSVVPYADYVGHVRKLEQVIILALARLGVVSGQMRGLTGVWVQPHVLSCRSHCTPQKSCQPAKIAAIGIKVDARGVSRHGFALNVAPDMSYYAGIVSCGLKDHPVASLADILETPPSMACVAEEIVAAFQEIYGFEMLQQNEADHFIRQPGSTPHPPD
ncbi:MAG: lipoyl(octanoyl) transferase LipB [Anaerolineales bacterium]|nr:lipoyl(octanoyl) transferase LipB [Anaerolineales bacterium]